MAARSPLGRRNLGEGDARRIHFPEVVKNGVYTYRAIKIHMPQAEGDYSQT